MAPSAITRLGRKYAGSWFLAAAGLPLIVLGALLESLLLLGIGLSLGIAGLLLCAVVMRADSVRERAAVRELLTGIESNATEVREAQIRADSLSRRALTAAIDQLGATVVSEFARLQAGVAEAVSSGSDDAEIRLRSILAAEGDRTAGEVQSFLRLRGMYDSVAVPLPMEPSDALPSQVLKVMEMVNRVKPSSVITSSLTHGAVWIAHALRGQGHISALCSDAAEVQHLEEVVRADDLEKVLTVVDAPMTRVDVPHHYLHWHDLAALDPERTFDFAVISGNGVDDRRALPFVPLLRYRLAPGTLVAVVGPSTQDECGVLAHWVEQYSMSIEESLSFDGVTVLRSP